MVRIRLRRVGSKKQPSYRIVIADSRSPRDGRYVEVIGFYNPRTQPPTMTVKEDRALYWLSKGAKPSEAVHRILDKQGTLVRYERLRQGESMEALVAEAEAQQAAQEPVSPKTKYQAPTRARKAKAPAEAETEAAEAEAEVEEAEMEAEAAQAEEEAAEEAEQAEEAAEEEEEVEAEQ